MSHRIIVMCEGRITGELDAAEATQEGIMTYATMRTGMVANDETNNPANGAGRDGASESAAESATAFTRSGEA